MLGRFYPTGARVAADGFLPSGMLVRAVMLNGAGEMLGVTEEGLPLDASPSVRQGFGRVYLAASVKLAGVDNSPSGIFVADVEDIAAGQVRSPRSPPRRARSSPPIPYTHGRREGRGPSHSDEPRGYPWRGPPPSRARIRSTGCYSRCSGGQQ